MDMFNKLKDKVTGIVPGNPVTREFEVSTHRGSAGPGLLWKVYDAIKKTTKQEASVFMFEKKQLERYPRHDRDAIVESLKKGVTQLTRLRHPKILSVLHPIEESRESLAFATEPVFASLANVLGQHENLPSPVPPDISDHTLYDVEIRYGLLQVSEGLAFLHNSVKLVHHNMCPTSIMLNKNGAWKLGGFDFAIPNANQQDQANLPFYPYKEWTINQPDVIQPNLDYLAPESVMSMACDTSSDMYSMGIMCYSIYNNGKSLFQCRNELSTYKSNVKQLKNLNVNSLRSIPEEFRDHVKMLLNMEPSLRPDADQLSKIPFFEDIGAMTLQYLDNLFQQDNVYKSQFFKGLPQIVAKMPKRVNLQRVVPALFKECVNPAMVPFILPCILNIGEQSTDAEFVRCIMPQLLPLFRLQEPVQISLIFLQNMQLLLSKTPQNEIKNHVLPMVYRSLENESPQIQSMCLSIIPTFASLIEYSAMKNALMPRIRKLCLATTNLSIRVNCLVTIGKLLEFMDKWYVLDDILPILQEIPSREPAVLMSMLGIFKVTMTHAKLGITKDVMANKVLPFLFPLCIDNNLNLSQFNAFMSVVKEMVAKVESEQRTKLEQLSSMQGEQKQLHFSGDGVSMANDGKSESMMDKLMSGFGISTLFGGAAKTDEPKGPKPDLANPINQQMNEIPMPKSQDTQMPNTKAKVSLSLEEKQRLAKEQEQQQRYKSQAPLQAKTATPAASKSQPKDLTSSLLNSNLTSFGNKVPSSSNTMGSTGSSNFGSNRGANSFGSNNMGTGSSGFGMSNTNTGMTQSNSFGMSSGGANMTQNFGASTMSSGSSIFGANSDQGMSSFGAQSKPPSTSKSMDMSSLDSLLPAKSNPSMNQMKPQGGMSQGNMSQGFGMQQNRPMGNMGNQGGMGNFGNQSTMGNMGMMGNQNMMGNFGNQNMMGNQGMGNMGMGNQGMMGGMGMQQMGGQSMMKPNMSNAQQNSSKLSSRDIDDLLS